MAINWDKKGCETPSGRWITRSGIDKALSDMSDDHIINCIKFIYKYGGKLTDIERSKIDELKEELSERGKEVVWCSE